LISYAPSYHDLFRRAATYVDHERAGKHQSGKMRKGNRWLRTALIEAAAGASRVKNSALQARFRRVLRHRGPKKAVAAVAHALLRATYHVLADHARSIESSVPITAIGSTANASPVAQSSSSSARATA
jgi:hypothetical protein